MAFRRPLAVAMIACLFAIFAATSAHAKHKRLKPHAIPLAESLGCVLGNDGHKICREAIQRAPDSRRATAAYEGGAVVAHPAGCPWRLFCGCGVSVKVFGRPVRELFLAANWRKFPPASPASGMVAWRWGHVMYILTANGDGTAEVYDPNSGGHKTRVHTRSLAGYRVVNPHGSRVAERRNPSPPS